MTPRPAPLRDQALALAGVAQFALYAHELAAEGRDQPQRIAAAHRAILCTDPDGVIDVYGNLSGVGDGMAYLRGQLAGRRPNQKIAVVARYIGQILRLSSRVRKHKTGLARIGKAIERAREREPEQATDIFDAAYRNNVSPLKPRILLQGHPSYLDNTVIQARARTLLLAAVRCAILWRQCGGGFFSLFFRRKALLRALNSVGPSDTVH